VHFQCLGHVEPFATPCVAAQAPAGEFKIPLAKGVIGMRKQMTRKTARLGVGRGIQAGYRAIEINLVRILKVDQKASGPFSGLC
jgi:hypothetical protein